MQTIRMKYGDDEFFYISVILPVGSYQKVSDLAMREQKTVADFIRTSVEEKIERAEAQQGGKG